VPAGDVPQRAIGRIEDGQHQRRRAQLRKPGRERVRPAEHRLQVGLGQEQIVQHGA